MSEPTKRCPMCGEEILAVAIKCKHCGERLDTPPSSSRASPIASPTFEARQGPGSQPETTLFSRGDTVVTTSRAIIGGTTYSIPNVTSVASARVPPDTARAALLSNVGAALIIGGAFFTMLIFVALKDGSVAGGLFDAILAAGLIGSGIALRRRAAAQRQSATPTFLLKVTTAGGEVEALRTKDQALVDELLRALTGAIAKR